MSEAFFTILGVMIGTFIPWLKEWMREKKERTEQAKYLAAQIICVLDEYIEKCCDVVGDDGSVYGSPSTPDGRYEPQVALPDLLVYPEDIDWKSIEGDLMYEILSLPNNVRKTNRYINIASDNASPPDYDDLFEARWEGYANLGLKAIKLKETLKKQYKLPDESFDLNPEWNAKQYLTEKINEIKETSTSRALAFEAMTKNIGKNDPK